MPKPYIHDDGAAMGTALSPRGKAMNVTRRVSAGPASDKSFFKATLDLLPHPVAVCNADDLRIVYANDHATSELKLLRPEIPGETELVVGESIEAFLPGAVVQSQALLDLGDAHRRSIRLIGRTLDVSVKKLVSESDAAELLIVTWSNTTERDSTPWFDDVANGDSEAHPRIAQFTIDQSADAVYWVREDGSLAYFNETAASMLGYSREEMAALLVMDINPDYPTAAWATAWRNMEPDDARIFESSQRRKDGRLIPVEISSNFLKFGNDSFNISTIRDISDRRRTEDEIRDRETRLRQAQRMARLGSFARDMKTDQVWIEGIGELFGTWACKNVRRISDAVRVSGAVRASSLFSVLACRRGGLGCFTATTGSREGVAAVAGPYTMPA